ncbi:MAG: PLP-dependent transferase [Erysipelotrichaceae bacterium]|nr:PLP-dependent transferase [Erysipelotrichaceae bacterium]
MKKIRDYCKKRFHFDVFADEYLKKLEQLLDSGRKDRKDAKIFCMKKEMQRLFSLLKKQGYECEGKRGLIFDLTLSYMKKELDRKEFVSCPLDMISFEEEIENQYRLVDIMHRNFSGYEALNEGDYGCHIDGGRPQRTKKVEKVLAEYFGSEDAALVRGGGTGAIRSLCFVMMRSGDRVLVHDASMYYTTQLTLEGIGVEMIRADFNDFEEIRRSLKEGIDVLYIQRVRQKLSDRYDTVNLIRKVRKIDRNVKIIVDENYAVNKVKYLGCAVGADASAFSTFKLLGIPGIGLICGKKDLIAKIHEQNYSGGGQVQGPEATEILRSLVNNPVLLAVQDRAADEIVNRLEAGEVKHVEKALKANLEERIILVKLDLPIAAEVNREAEKLGALPHPVGSESRYEVQALFYRVARVMIEEEPLYEKYVIRINPMRSGPDTVIRILKGAIDSVLK